MARESTSSSASTGNGHPRLPSNANVGVTRDPSDEQMEGRSSDRERQSDSHQDTRTIPLPFDPSLLPNGSRSLSSIGLQSFFLGFTLAACTFSTVWLLSNEKSIWRFPAFFACLSVFHFLEYWTTASFNLPAVRASSFLLFSNGTAYNVAHTLAALEITVSSFCPPYQRTGVNVLTISAGITLVVIGQLVRSVAMAQAGTNFNHVPAKAKKEGHELVTTGVYGYFRHPSYFGFFWWAIGTQLLVGNKICLAGYIVALWNFFNRRIRSEERTLVEFFGDDYENFRRLTKTWIPLIP